MKQKPYNNVLLTSFSRYVIQESLCLRLFRTVLAPSSLGLYENLRQILSYKPRTRLISLYSCHNCFLRLYICIVFIVFHRSLQTHFQDNFNLTIYVPTHCIYIIINIVTNSLNYIKFHHVSHIDSQGPIYASFHRKTRGYKF